MSRRYEARTVLKDEAVAQILVHTLLIASSASQVDPVAAALFTGPINTFKERYSNHKLCIEVSMRARCLGKKVRDESDAYSSGELEKQVRIPQYDVE